MKFNTKTIHGGQSHEPQTGAVMVPIFQTSTYAQESPGKDKGYDYSRGGNPTRSALEAALASIENGTRGLAFSSGLGAIDAVIKLLSPGDEVIAMNDLYGGTFRLFTQIYQKYGIKFHFIDLNDLDEVKRHLNSNTKLVWIETPTNPLLQIVDIRKVVETAKSKDCLIAVDNTFATPYNQTALDLGADIIMHSATKYLGGHSDLIAGALVCKDDDLANKLHFQLFAGGACLGPQDSFLVLRGIKTLGLRMQRHAENAMKIATFLEDHSKVAIVYYPGLKSHKAYEIASQQMKTFGGMLSFTLKSESKDDAFKVLENLKVFTLAESLGGVESLANHPATMTHASIPAENRKELGITDDLIRLSVGIEDAEDLIQDLEQTLNTIK